jgi:predicted sugar kinase
LQRFCQADDVTRFPPSCRPPRLSLSRAARNFDEFSEALFWFGQGVGEYFAPVQRGIFADWRMDQLAWRLQSLSGSPYHHHPCVGQTSWGPTLFVACRDADAAQDVAHSVHEYAANRVIPWDNLDVRIVAARNRGANVE